MVMKRHVLVVDDEKGTLALVCQLLGKLGFQTTAANSGEEALRCLKIEDRIDLVLTDINMPKMDGWALALQIKATYPNMPIIAMTGESPGAVTPRLNSHGIDRVLFKPFKPIDLMQAISHVLDRPSGKRTV